MNLDDTQATTNDTIKPSTIRHLEQHELTMGWVRCCDDDGIYYWHKPSGTVTRTPPPDQVNLLTTTTTPSLILPIATKQNCPFDFNECNNSDNVEPALSSPSSTSTSTSTSSSSSSSPRPTKTNSSYRSSRESTQCIDNRIALQRFYVRSLGWLQINEEDLTAERSSKAVNKCINDLSGRKKGLNDAVAGWGEVNQLNLSIELYKNLIKFFIQIKKGKDLYLDLEGVYLILRDTNDEKVLNKQVITSIRVWGVGRDNSR
jgi:amyloid beta A4 precursor protein-binding family B member 2